MAHKPEVAQLLAGSDIVGESIVWDTERRCLFWVDIIGRAIRRYDPEAGTERRWNLRGISDLDRPQKRRRRHPRPDAQGCLVGFR